MKRILAAVLVLAVLAASPSISAYAADEEKVAAPVKNIDIKDAAAVTDAAALSTALAEVTTKVMACIKETETPLECQCKFPTELGNVRTRYDEAIKNHPEWKGAMVNFREEGKEATSVSLGGVAKQLEECK